MFYCNQLTQYTESRLLRHAIKKHNLLKYKTLDGQLDVRHRNKSTEIHKNETFVLTDSRVSVGVVFIKATLFGTDNTSWNRMPDK